MNKIQSEIFVLELDNSMQIPIDQRLVYHSGVKMRPMHRSMNKTTLIESGQGGLYTLIFDCAVSCSDSAASSGLH